MISWILLLFFAVAIGIPVGLLWRHLFAEAEIPPEIRVPGAATIDTQECRLAVHEAGHAVAAWCCTLVTEVNAATIEDEKGGLVSFTYRHSGLPEERWCQMVIALAGVAAEGMVYSKWSTKGSEKDLGEALVFAKVLRENPPWERLGRASGSVPNFQKMSRTKLDPDVIENVNEAYRMARRVLRSHGSQFFKVVSMLLTKKATRKVDLEAVLGMRHLERIVATGAIIESILYSTGKPERFKPRFVLPRRSGKKAA